MIPVFLLIAKLLGAFAGGALAARMVPRLRSSVAYRKGWQAAAWEMLSAVQVRHAQVREAAVKSAQAWNATKEGLEGQPNPEPVPTLTIGLDEVRTMAEAILRNPPRREAREPKEKTP